MGSNSRGKDGEGSSGVSKFEDENDEQEMKFVPHEPLLHTNGFGVPLLMHQVTDISYHPFFFFKFLLFN